VDTFLIGDNPFIGVSHMSQVLARERVERLQLKQIMKVMEKAITCGASGYTFSTHPVNFEIVRSLREIETLDRPFSLYPVLPYAEGYVRLNNEKGTIGLLREVLSRLSVSGKAKLLVKGGLSAATFDAIRLLKAYVDMELTSYLNVKPTRTSFRAVFLHEIVTDLALSFGASQIFDSFMHHVADKYEAKPGFVTRNFVKFVHFFQEHDLPLKQVAIMTPFNKIGFQMNPSEQDCKACYSRLSQVEVIAISILAGGYLGLDEAVEYLRGLPGLSGVAIGVSSEQHAEDSFRKLRASLGE